MQKAEEKAVACYQSGNFAAALRSFLNVLAETRNARTFSFISPIATTGWGKRRKRSHIIARR